MNETSGTYTRDEAMRKAAALLRLAARGGTVQEAAAAAARAQAIMDRYELTAGDAEGYAARGSDDEPVTSFYEAPEGWMDDMPRRIPWRWSLASGIAAMHGCYIFNGRRGKGCAVEIVGRASQVETVRYLYSWLAREIEMLTGTHGNGMGAVWRREFSEGAASEIVNRLKAQRAETVAEVKQEQAGNPLALVRVESALQRMDPTPVAEWARKHHGLVASRGGGHRQYNPSARDAGRAAARSINLHHGARRIGGQS